MLGALSLLLALAASASRLLSQQAIDGVIFRCSLPVDTDLDAV